MSKQLAISAAFSVFAMAAFVLSSTADRPAGLAMTQTGAEAFAAAPAAGPSVTGLISINR